MTRLWEFQFEGECVVDDETKEIIEDFLFSIPYACHKHGFIHTGSKRNKRKVSK